MMSSNKRQKSGGGEEEEEVVIVYKEGVNVPKNVTKVIFDASVTEIPAKISDRREGIFSHCKQLKEVELNNGLRGLGIMHFFIAHH